ncbi:MAG: glycosyltransferase, partial [bacterium]
MEMHVGDIAGTLSEKGDSVYAICAPGSRLENDLRKRKILCHTINAGGYFRPFAILNAAKIFRHIQPDILHVHYSKDLWWVVPGLFFGKKIPAILSKHIGTQKPKRDPLHRLLYAHLRFIIAISNVIRKNIIETHPVSADRVVVIHHGVDLSRYNPNAIDRNIQRQQLGFSRTDLVIGIIGRLQASKGYYEFLEMAASLKDDYCHCRFLLVGEASRGEEADAKKILDYIDRLKLQEIVKWCGYREDIPEVLSAMDIFVFPSHAEAFGLVLIEAMAMAKPVIASNCDGVLDIMIDGETGLLVQPKNSPTLTQ